MINWLNLRKRLGFAAAAVPISLAVITSQFSLSAFALGLFGMDKSVLPDIYPGQILAVIIVMFGAYEYMKMLSAANKINAFWLGYVWILASSCAYLFDYRIPNVVSNSALLMIVAFEAFFFGKAAQHGRWKRASLFFIGMMFLNIASIGIMGFYREPFQKLFASPALWSFGYLEIVVVIAATFFCDTAAYFVGSTLGKRRFSTISPNKTVEGSLAGLAASAIFTAVCWIFIRNPDCPMYIGIIMGVIIGVMAQVGDLLVSLIKRYFKVKDASDIIPGHGGILDRFDSLFFTAPALFSFAWILGKLNVFGS